MERERWIGLSLSGALHAALLFGAGLFLAQKGEFGVAPGQSSVAVEMVEGPARAEERKPEAPPPETPAKSDSAEMTLLRKREPRTTPSLRSTPGPPPKPHPVAASNKGVAGASRDPATVRRANGSTAQPDYLRNPPPVYPEESRRKGEQGTALVKVLVSPQGTSQAVALDRSSGFPSLDRAALEAVLRWRFRAATSGGAPVASYAVVPIVFRLASN